MALSVLSLLLAGLPVLQRYHQLQFAAVGAARESAWLASWNIAGAARVDLAQLQARWLPEGATPSDAGPATQPAAVQAGVDAARSSLPGLAAQGAQALLLPARPLQALGSGFDLRADGLIRARASLQVATPDHLPAPFGGLALTLSEQHALVADGWGAAGPAQVAKRAGGLVPTSLLARVPGLVTVGTALLSVIEPQFRHFCPGIVDPEIVPADRLARAVDEAPVTGWRVTC
ncbi:MAG: hypothetical protein RL684_2637 [Pseudomonadota bacterium]